MHTVTGRCSSSRGCHSVTVALTKPSRSCARQVGTECGPLRLGDGTATVFLPCSPQQQLAYPEESISIAPLEILCQSHKGQGYLDWGI